MNRGSLGPNSQPSCRDFLAEVLADGETTLRSWQLADGTAVSMPAAGAIELTPPHSASADRVLLSCGVHGNETAPVEIVNHLLNDVLQGRLVLKCRLMVLLGNLQALRQNARYLDYDMNRLFDGAHREHPEASEAARAAQLEHLAARFFSTPAPGARCLHLDLHTAIRASVFPQFAIYPFLHQRQYDRPLLAWLHACLIDTVLLHTQPARTFSYFTSQRCGADALTLELGKARPFGHNRLEDFAAIDQGIRLLVSQEACLTTAVPDVTDAMRLYRAKYDVIKHSDHFRLHLPDTVENFTLLADGFVIAEDGDTRYVASGGEERILFPNPKVKNGLRAGIVVEPARLPEAGQ